MKAVTVLNGWKESRCRWGRSQGVLRIFLSFVCYKQATDPNEPESKKSKGSPAKAEETSEVDETSDLDETPEEVTLFPTLVKWCRFTGFCAVSEGRYTAQITK